MVESKVAACCMGLLQLQGSLLQVVELLGCCQTAALKLFLQLVNSAAMLVFLVVLRAKQVNWQWFAPCGFTYQHVRHLIGEKGKRPP